MFTGTHTWGEGPSPGGPAGGDLAGNYPNPTVTESAVNHNALANLTTGDPHTQYQKESEKDQASGYAGLSAGSKLALGQIPTGISHATLADLTTGDPHTQYVLDTDLTTALALYQLESEKDQANGYAGLDAGSKLDGSQQTYGTTADTACEGNDARLTGAAVSEVASAAQVVQSDTLTADDTLTHDLDASSTYGFDFLLFFSTSNNAVDAKFALGGTAGVDALKAQIKIDGAAGTRVTAFDSAVSADVAAGDHYCVIEGTITTTTAGTLLDKFAELNNDAGQNVTRQTLSRSRVWKIS